MNFNLKLMYQYNVFICIHSMPETQGKGRPLETGLTVATPIQGLLAETHCMCTVTIKYQITNEGDAMALSTITT